MRSLSSFCASVCPRVSAGTSAKNAANDTASATCTAVPQLAPAASTADATVTMLAYKPGLVASAGAPWVGAVKLAKLGVDASKYLEAEERA